jgi:DNA (cytosine-5)-methyltransferase 1
MKRKFGCSVGQPLDEPAPAVTAGGGGKPFIKTQQVHMCGNSVSPPPMAALARANDPWKVLYEKHLAA